MVAELAANVSEWNLISNAEELAGKRVLLVAGTRDVDTPIEVNHTPFLQALEAAGVDAEEVVFESDHSFSDRRIALARSVVEFLNRCVG